jgi:transcriptional regulator with XRE-family HTH domain
MTRPFLDTDALFVAVDRRRRKSGMLWRDVAAEAGLSSSTLTRLGRGYSPSTDGLVRILTWLGHFDLTPYITQDQKPDEENPDAEWS